MTVQHEVRVVVEVAAYDLAVSIMWEYDVVAITEQIEGEAVMLIGAFPSLELEQLAITRLARIGTISVHEPEPGVWADQWRAGAKPTVAGSIAVTLPGIEPPAGVQHHIVIEPHTDDGASGAFGHGGHPTTTLLLELLQTVPVTGLDVVDIGTGTGVLAIAACRLGATRVDAVDIDAEAVSVAVANRRANALTPPQLALSQGSVEDIAATGHGLVLANLTAGILLPMADQLRERTASDGALLVSGLLAEQDQRAREAFAPLEVTQMAELDGWIAFVLQHERAPSA